MLICHGKIQTCTNQTSHNSPSGVMHSRRGNKTWENISRGLSLLIDESYFSTDITCVLRYLENRDRRFQTFVANRVAIIHDASSPSQWRYVNTQFNPADDASRGMSADSLQRWIHGPEFLTHATETWPQQPVEIAYMSKAYVRDPVSEIIGQFSSWTLLKKIVAYILHYKSTPYISARNEGQEWRVQFSSPAQLRPSP